MICHPITFQAHLVPRILTGAKTQTRRVIAEACRLGYPHGEIIEATVQDFATVGGLQFNWRCPYGRPGDYLWVREAWAFGKKGEEIWQGGIPWTGGGPDNPEWLQDIALFYKANTYPQDMEIKWRSSRFMPKWAARLALQVVEVRVERLQDLSEYDAAQEGIPLQVCTHPACVEARMRTGRDPCAAGSYRAAFALGWDKINGARGYTWASNPWVWAITFKLHKEGNIWQHLK